METASKSNRIPILISYSYLGSDLRKLVKSRREDIEFMLDSGAFTAFKMGKEVTLDGYCGFLDTLRMDGLMPDCYYTLDVIGQPEQTLRNYEIMLSRGFKPIPIATRGDTEETVNAYYQTSDYVAFGGLASANLAGAQWAAKMIEWSAGRKAHLLGMTRWPLIKLLKPYSVDSSSWKQGGRFGTVSVYMGHGVMELLHPRQLTRAKLNRRVAERIRKLGYDPYSIFAPDAGKGVCSTWQNITTASWVEFSCELRRVLGVKLFFAITTSIYTRLLMQHYDAGRYHGKAV